MIRTSDRIKIWRNFQMGSDQVHDVPEYWNGPIWTGPENLRDPGPARTRTEKILEISDQVGPGLRKISKPRTELDQDRKKFQNLGPDQDERNFENLGSTRIGRSADLAVRGSLVHSMKSVKWIKMNSTVPFASTMDLRLTPFSCKSIIMSPIM